MTFAYRDNFFPQKRAFSYWKSLDTVTNGYSDTFSNPHQCHYRSSIVTLIVTKLLNIKINQNPIISPNTVSVWEEQFSNVLNLHPCAVGLGGAPWHALRIPLRRAGVVRHPPQDEREDTSLLWNSPGALVNLLQNKCAPQIAKPYEVFSSRETWYSAARW